MHFWKYRYRFDRMSIGILWPLQARDTAVTVECHGDWVSLYGHGVWRLSCRRGSDHGDMTNSRGGGTVLVFGTTGTGSALLLYENMRVRGTIGPCL